MHAVPDSLIDIQNNAVTLNIQKEGYLLAEATILTLENVEFAERAGGIDVQPFLNASRVEMVVARELADLTSIIVWTNADATFLYRKIILSKLWTSIFTKKIYLMDIQKSNFEKYYILMAQVWNES